MKARKGKSSLRQVLLGYIVGAWALLEIVVTVSELAGLPLAVPRMFVLILAGGLLVVLGVVVVKRGVHAVQRASSSASWEARRAIFGALAIFLILLPGSFLVADGSLEWIMWRDAPLLALASAASAIASAMLGRICARLASSAADGAHADDPPLDSGPAV